MKWFYWKWKRIVFRLENGFKAEEWFGFNYHHALWVLPRLTYLRDHHLGYPTELGSDEEWVTVLDKMIVAFELYAEDKIKISTSELEQAEEGLRLFAKFYPNLWD
mgnify:CR=1 FL=1